MAAQLLITKLYVAPIRPELVARPRLIQRLNAGLRPKLTLVPAPAGFGKTTVPSEWIQHAERPVAWLSLNGGDNDPVHSWRYVIAALQTVDTTVGETLQTALQCAQLPSLDSFVTALISDLTAVSTPPTLVLNDYHVIDAMAVSIQCNYLVCGGWNEPCW